MNAPKISRIVHFNLWLSNSLGIYERNHEFTFSHQPEKKELIIQEVSEEILKGNTWVAALNSSWIKCYCVFVIINHKSKPQNNVIDRFLIPERSPTLFKGIQQNPATTVSNPHCLLSIKNFPTWKISIIAGDSQLIQTDWKMTQVIELSDKVIK